MYQKRCYDNYEVKGVLRIPMFLPRGLVMHIFILLCTVCQFKIHFFSMKRALQPYIYVYTEASRCISMCVNTLWWTVGTGVSFLLCLLCVRSNSWDLQLRSLTQESNLRLKNIKHCGVLWHWPNKWDIWSIWNQLFLKINFSI